MSKKLYIVSLKKFYIKDDKVHTYGGFGEYVKMFLDDFDEVHLCVPLSPKEIEGGYVLEDEKLHYHFLPYYTHELSLMIRTPLIFLYLLFYLRKADVINPRIPDMTGVSGWLIGKLFRKPMFVSIQSDITLLLENDNSTKLKGIMKKGLFAWLRFYLFFEKIIMKNSIAFPQGQRLVEKYCKNNPKAVPWISTALDDKDIVLNLKEKSLKEQDKITLLNVGRLTRAKNQITLVESLNILHAKGYKKVYLKIVGKMDDNIFKELHTAIKQYKLEKYIEFIEPVNHGIELWKIFDSADMFVFSSIWEGTPKVLLEALARSLPVVSTNVGGIPSVIKDRKNGLLCDKEDSKAFAKNIEEFINMPKEGINTYIQNGNQEVNKYTIFAQKKVLIDSLYKFGILDAKN